MVKKKAKTLPKLIDSAATKLQKLVRLKAANENGLVQCVTCDKWAHWKDMQGGHFIARGSKKWKLVEENVHPQCPGCNGFGMKYGNAEAVYTAYMIDMYGRDFVDEMLRTKSEVKKYSRSEVEDIDADFSAQIKHHEKRVV